MKKRLSAEAVKWRDKLRGAYELEDAAGQLYLQLAAESFDLMRSAEKILDREGLTVKDRFGQPKANPAVLVQRDARAALLRALRALNLDVEPPGDIGRTPGS